MTRRRPESIQPLGWQRPRGYVNGVVAEGRVLFVAGQIGWDPRAAKPTLPATFAEQFDQALANVVEVVREAGGTPDRITRATIYVLDRAEYVAAAKEMGAAWRRRIGRHYPAMTLVVVAGLLEERAKLEIEATAVL